MRNRARLDGDMFVYHLFTCVNALDMLPQLPLMPFAVLISVDVCGECFLRLYFVYYYLFVLSEYIFCSCARIVIITYTYRLRLFVSLPTKIHFYSGVGCLLNDSGFDVREWDIRVEVDVLSLRLGTIRIHFVFLCNNSSQIIAHVVTHNVQRIAGDLQMEHVEQRVQTVVVRMRDLHPSAAHALYVHESVVAKNVLLAREYICGRK